MSTRLITALIPPKECEQHGPKGFNYLQITNNSQENLKKIYMTKQIPSIQSKTVLNRQKLIVLHLIKKYQSWKEAGNYDS